MAATSARDPAGPSFDHSEENLALGWEADLQRLAGEMDALRVTGQGSRALSLAQTKVEEAAHWLRTLDRDPGGR